MAICEVVSAEQGHLLYVAENICSADREELKSAGREDVYQALLDSADICVQPLAGVIDGEPVCVFGVSQVSLAVDIGIVWLISTDKLRSHVRPFLKIGKAWVNDSSKNYKIMANFVSKDHKVSIKWLKWLGFKVALKEIPLGPDSRPFYYFSLREGQHGI
jgi:hypothetical protein